MALSSSDISSKRRHHSSMVWSLSRMIFSRSVRDGARSITAAPLACVLRHMVALTVTIDRRSGPEPLPPSMRDGAEISCQWRAIVTINPWLWPPRYGHAAP